MNNSIETLKQFNISYKVIGCVYCLVNSSTGSVIRRDVTGSQVESIVNQLLSSRSEFELG